MHELQYLADILILLTVSIVNVVISKRIQLSPVLGYLILGTLIGEFKLITNTEYAHSISEFGVVFLLFVIGLELTFERIIQMRFHVFGFGGLQLALTSTLFTFILSHFLEIKLAIAIVIAGALSLSSTAVVLQVLYENKRQSTQVGRLSLAVLLMQDFAVVPLLALVPIIAVSQENIAGVLGVAGLKALIAIILITIAGRIFLRPFFSIIGTAKSDEVYVSTTLLIVLGAALLTNELGLSTAMGAFISGILIAETQYRTRVENSIMPFKSLLLGLFFLSVGMSIDVKLIKSQIDDIIFASLGLIFIKGLVIYLLCKLFRFRQGASLHSALLLCQGSEFAFILFGIAAQQGAIAHETAQLLLVVVAITMAITPLLSILGHWLEERIDAGEELDGNQEFKGISDLDGHIIIAGFGRVGRVIAYMLSDNKFNYVAVDSDLQLVKKARSQGFPVYHGDLSSVDVLRSVGASRASAVILTMSDKIALRKTVKMIRVNFDSLEVIVRAEDFKHGQGLKKLGASAAVPSTIETGLQLGGALLKNLGVAEHDILNIKDQFRQNSYSFTEEIELFKGVVNSKTK
jgi:CPA2 family monovalent cation:H+ antiporter-2